MISTAWPRVSMHTFVCCRMSLKKPLNRGLFIKTFRLLMMMLLLLLLLLCASIYCSGERVRLKPRIQWYRYFQTVTIIIHSQNHSHQNIYIFIVCITLLVLHVERWFFFLSLKFISSFKYDLKTFNGCLCVKRLSTTIFFNGRKLVELKAMDYGRNISMRGIIIGCIVYICVYGCYAFSIILKSYGSIIYH